MSMISAWMDEEYLMKCVVDPLKKTFYLYSNEGDSWEDRPEADHEYPNTVTG